MQLPEGTLLQNVMGLLFMTFYLNMLNLCGSIGNQKRSVMSSQPCCVLTTGEVRDENIAGQL